MSYEWDPAKLQANLDKHGVDFVDAAGVFQDPDAITIPDPDRAPEERLVT